VDATAASGLDFVHVNGAAGRLLLPEVIGSGGALFDYDNDGDLDVFAVQGVGDGSRLFRNDWTAGRPVRFTDVTSRSAIAVTGYGMGAATGDIDNDGDVDLFVTALGASWLLRNNGDGTFADVTVTAGAGDSRWSTSATFVDYDRDGWLDLFVANYVDFRDADLRRECFSPASARDYCNPAAFQPVPARLLHNDRDGTFSDVSVRSGIGKSAARGLGVLAADLDDDGWTDLFVANDGDPNHLWINQNGTKERRQGVPGDAVTFRDGALLAGVAVSRAGQPQGSMGIDLADVDRDGDEDLFVTNLDNEGNTLYVNQGKGLFEDRTVEAGLFALGFTGFGTRFLDYDGDGALDLVVANGAVRQLGGQARRGDPYPLRQRNHLFRNNGRGRFTDVSARSGAPFTSLAVARGVASGDLDNDGDADLVVFNNNGPARVLLNQSSGAPDSRLLNARGAPTYGAPRHWLGLRVLDGRYGRDALTARVSIGGIVHRVQVDGSYLTASDPRVLVALGADASPQTVRVRWPGGAVEEFSGLAVDRYWVVEQGRPARAP